MHGFTKLAQVQPQRVSTIPTKTAMWEARAAYGQSYSETDMPRIAVRQVGQHFLDFSIRNIVQRLSTVPKKRLDAGPCGSSAHAATELAECVELALRFIDGFGNLEGHWMSCTFDQETNNS
ncbi:hypothetical protein, partial [Rhodoblastus sphagnicola]